MKNTFIKIALSLFVALSFVGCETVVEFKGEYTEPQLVLYSVVTAGEPVVVHLSNSVFILDEANPTKQRWARVELHINGEFVERLAEYDYTETVSEQYGNCVNNYVIRHQYYKSTHTCSSGDEVEIRVRHKDFEGEVSGKTTIPQEPILGELSATITPSEDDEYSSSNTKGNVYCPLTNEAGVANYYWLRGCVVAKYIYLDNETNEFYEYYHENGFGFENDIVFTGVNTGGFFDDLLGGSSGLEKHVFFDDSLIDGEEEYPLTMNYGFLAEACVEEPIFRVECWQIDDNLYKYLRSMELADSDNFLSEPVQIHSNIEGGIGLVGSRSTLIVRTLPFSEAKR